MSTMNRGEELALRAMKKELVLLSRKAERAKAEADEFFSVGTEMLSIHKDFKIVVESKKHDDETIKKIDDLKKRSEKTERIRKKNHMKLSDKQFNTQYDRDCLASEIQRLEYRYSL
jgi:hypothetical protein